MIKLFEDAFAVAVMRTDDFDIKNPTGKFQVIKNGLKFWVADPFPIEVNGSLYIFAEMWRYHSFKGCIAYTKYTNHEFTAWKPIIEESFHLSYPNIFYYDGTLYMCPESNESGKILLYECVDFPERWELRTTLYKGDKYCDTTFYMADQKIYGFTYKLNAKKEDELKIFRVKNGELQFSNNNLDIIDSNRIRPGGKIYFDTNTQKWLRVVQIGTPTYGSGITFTDFNLEWPNFKEVAIASILPEDFHYDLKKKITGIHTFNRTEHYIVVDIKWSRINFLELYWKIIRKCKKIISKWSAK